MNKNDIDYIHSCGPDCQRPICVLVRKAVAAERNKLTAWMIQFGFATGHGDTMEQLLDALGTEIVDRIEIEVDTEREACAKQLEAVGCDHCAANIRLRGKE